MSILGQNYHTEFEYGNSNNNGITIKNSYPKGGQKYTAPNGEKFVYVTFWTCITNKTASNLELEINFSSDSFIIPSSPNVNFNLYIPNEEMALEKDLLPDYGLDIMSFLEENINVVSKLVSFPKENINESSKLKAIIKPNNSHLFYTVAISNKGVIGPLRAGFELQKEELIYKINKHEINCGKISAKR